MNILNSGQGTVSPCNNVIFAHDSESKRFRINRSGRTWDSSRPTTAEYGSIAVLARPSGQAGLTGFEQIMARADARCEKILEDREVWHLRVACRGRSIPGIVFEKTSRAVLGQQVKGVVGDSARPDPGPDRGRKRRRAVDRGHRRDAAYCLRRTAALATACKNRS